MTKETSDGERERASSIPRIGVGSYALRYAIGTADLAPPEPLTPSTLLVKAAALGAQVVQILDNLPLDRLSEHELRELRSLAGDLGITIETGIRGSRLEKLRRNLAVTEALGASIIRAVLTDDGWEPDRNQVLEILASVLPDLRAAGVTLAIENRFHYLPSQVAEMIGAMDDPHVAACLDVMNSITRFVGPSEAVAALAPYAVSVHIKDARIARERTGFRISGCAMGAGGVDVSGILAAVRREGRARSILVEGWMDPLGSINETLAQEEAWVRDGIDYVKIAWGQETG